MWAGRAPAGSEAKFVRRMNRRAQQLGLRDTRYASACGRDRCCWGSYGVAWFGIRGIGSVYYLMYAIHHGLPAAMADQIMGITLAAVATSIVLHGISVRPMMNLYW